MDLEKFLKENKGEHFNFVVPTTYKISTGSIELDEAMDGGFSPGIHRLCGTSEGGKSSLALIVANNFLQTVDNSRVILIKAEGRLSDKAKIRAGLEFTEDPVHWKQNPQKVFVFKCNIFDVVAQLVYDLTTDNPDGLKYMFIIDSMDGLILRADTQKSFDGDESVKIAGPQVLTKRLFKQTSLPVAEYGHMVFTLAQVIAKIPPKYEVKEQMNVGGSGGNAAIHFSNFILRFMPRYKSDYITKDGSAVELDSSENNVAGHWCNIEIQKSDNEKSGTKVSYPIKHGESGLNCIWREKEYYTALIRRQLLTKEKAWHHLSESFQAALKNHLDSDVEVPEKLYGEPKLTAFLSEPKVAKAIGDILFNYINKDVSL